MNKLTKNIMILFSVCLCCTILAGSAWASPWKKGNAQFGWQRFQVQNQLTSFRDIGQHWAKNDIEKLQSRGIMKGYENQMFMPEQPVSKNEAIAIITRVVDNNQQTTSSKDELLKSIFPNWMGNAPIQAYNDGIIADWELMNWDGNRPATRIEVAMWLCRASGDQKTSLQDVLNNTKDAGTLSKDELYYAAVMFNNGIMRGTSDGYLNPYKPISRGEFAVMISRYLSGQGSTSNSGTTTSTNNQELSVQLTPAECSKIAVDTKEFDVNFSQNMKLTSGHTISDLPGAIKILKYSDGAWVDANLQYAIVYTDNTNKLTIQLGNNDTLAANTKYCITINSDLLQTVTSSSSSYVNYQGIAQGEWSFTTNS